MKDLRQYIFETSRERAYSAYQKATGAQKNRILKLYHEIYDKNDDFIVDDPKVLDIYTELSAIVYDYCKAVETIYKKDEKKHKNDVMPYKLCCFDPGEQEASGYKTFGAEPSRTVSPIMFGLCGSDREALKIARDNITKKCDLYKKINDLAEKYPDYLSTYKNKGEITWYRDDSYGIHFKKEIPAINSLKDKQNANIILTSFYVVDDSNRFGLYIASSDGKQTYYSCWNYILANYYNKR